MGCARDKSRKDVELQTIPTDQLRIFHEGVELSEDAEVTALRQDDTARERQRKSDQAEYGLGDGSDGDYPHDTPA